MRPWAHGADEHISRILSCRGPVCFAYHPAVVGMINLHIALLRYVKPSTRPQCGTHIGSLFEVAARRDSPFHSNIIVYVTVALIVGLPRPVY